MTDASTPLPVHLSLVLPSDFAVLERVVEETEAFLAPHIDDGELVYKVTLLASEAVTNAIEHGNALDPEKKVRMELRLDPRRIALTVEDEGGGFDPARVRNPLDEENLLVDSGRGVYLIEQLADEVRFEQDGRRVLIFFDRPS